MNLLISRSVETYRSVLNTLERIVSGRFWLARSTVLIIIAALILQASPGIRGVLERVGDTYTAVEIKTNDLTYDLTEQFPPESNQAKQNFRLVMPIIAAIFGLNHIGLYVVQVAFGVGIIVLSLTISQQLLQDRTAAFLVGFTVAMIYGGATGFVETQSRFDAPSIFFLLLAVRIRNPVVIALSVFLAAWNDERGLIAASIAAAYYFAIAQTDRGILRRVLNPNSLGVAVGVLSYLITRLILASTYGISTPTASVGVDLIFRNITWIPLALWMMFEGGWILYLGAIALLLTDKRFLEIAASVGSLFVVFLTALAVVDVSRSTAYALPALFLALHILARYLEKHEVRAITFAAAALAFLWPMYYIEGGLTWIFPLPLQPFA